MLFAAKGIKATKKGARFPPSPKGLGFRLVKWMKKNEQHLIEIKQELTKINARLVSIESWLAALSTGKNLQASHKFAHDMTQLAERINPTLEIGV